MTQFKRLSPYRETTASAGVNWGKSPPVPHGQRTFGINLRFSYGGEVGSEDQRTDSGGETGI